MLVLGGDTAIGSIGGENSDESIAEELDREEGSAMADDHQNKVEGIPANISWIDGAKDLGLKTLFSETPIVHLYAQPRGTGAGERESKKGYSP